jgi:hypothetical protein
MNSYNTIMDAITAYTAQSNQKINVLEQEKLTLMKQLDETRIEYNSLVSRHNELKSAFSEVEKENSYLKKKLSEYESNKKQQNQQIPNEFMDLVMEHLNESSKSLFNTQVSTPNNNNFRQVENKQERTQEFDNGLFKIVLNYGSEDETTQSVPEFLLQKAMPFDESKNNVQHNKLAFKPIRLNIDDFETNIPKVEKPKEDFVKSRNKYVSDTESESDSDEEYARKHNPRRILNFDTVNTNQNQQPYPVFKVIRAKPLSEPLKQPSIRKMNPKNMRPNRTQTDVKPNISDKTSERIAKEKTEDGFNFMEMMLNQCLDECFKEEEENKKEKSVEETNPLNFLSQVFRMNQESKPEIKQETKKERPIEKDVKSRLANSLITDFFKMLEKGDAQDKKKEDRERHDGVEAKPIASKLPFF